MLQFFRGNALKLRRVPLLLGGVAWENKSWKLFAINAAYYFAAQQATAMILACRR